MSPQGLFRPRCIRIRGTTFPRLKSRVRSPSPALQVTNKPCPSPLFGSSRSGLARPTAGVFRPFHQLAHRRGYVARDCSAEDKPPNRGHWATERGSERHASTGLVKTFDRVLKAQDGTRHLRLIHEVRTFMDVRNREPSLLATRLCCLARGPVLQGPVEVRRCEPRIPGGPVIRVRLGLWCWNAAGPQTDTKAARGAADPRVPGGLSPIRIRIRGTTSQILR